MAMLIQLIQSPVELMESSAALAQLYTLVLKLFPQIDVHVEPYNNIK